MEYILRQQIGTNWHKLEININAQRYTYDLDKVWIQFNQIQKRKQIPNEKSIFALTLVFQYFLAALNLE